MPRTDLPERANALWRWMVQYRVTVEELADRVGIAPNYLGQIRRGERRPGDELKVKIAQQTLAVETELKVVRPKGVTIESWFVDLTDTDERK